METKHTPGPWEMVSEENHPKLGDYTIKRRLGIFNDWRYGVFNNKYGQLFGFQCFASVDECKQAIGDAE